MYLKLINNIRNIKIYKLSKVIYNNLNFIFKNKFNKRFFNLLFIIFLIFFKIKIN
jgi:hypothetical protein